MSAFNGSGTFVISGSGLPYVTATTISSTVANQLNTDLATGLSAVITKDGQTTTTGVIPFASGISIGGGATLSNYTQGTWTPVDASGAALAFTVARATYVRIGSVYFCDMYLTYPATANGADAQIGGLPGTWANVSGSGGTFSVFNGIASIVGLPTQNAATFTMLKTDGTHITNANNSATAIAAQFTIFTV